VKHTITYGDEQIRFSIRFLPQTTRNKKRVAIHVHPDGAVNVDAPEGTDVSAVGAAVRRRARWIWLRQTEYRERTKHVLPREYVSGETHFYLGKRYVLKVIENQTAPQGVKLLRGRLEVSTRSRDAEVVRRLLDAWYRQRAEEVFARRITACAAKASWMTTMPGFRLLTMRTQWGSCSPKGELLLNPNLVKAPGPCVEYVVFHELCHLKEHNHSKRFYELLGALLPDWQTWKSELDESAEHLLNR
jgi:predicted metal-dependent hydrolase